MPTSGDKFATNKFTSASNSVEKPCAYYQKRWERQTERLKLFAQILLLFSRYLRSAGLKRCDAVGNMPSMLLSLQIAATNFVHLWVLFFLSDTIKHRNLAKYFYRRP